MLPSLGRSNGNRRSAKRKNKKLCTETRPCPCLRGDARYLFDKSHAFCRANGRSNDAHPRQLPLHLLTEGFCSLFTCVFFSVISGSEGSFRSLARSKTGFLLSGGFRAHTASEMRALTLWPLKLKHPTRTTLNGSWCILHGSQRIRKLSPFAVQLA